MKPFVLPLVYTVLLTYSIHTRVDGREITGSEVNYSRTVLRKLLSEESFFQRNEGSTATIHDRKQTSRDSRNHHLRNVCRSGGGVTLLPRLFNDNQLKTWKNDLYKAIKNKEGKGHVRNNRGRLHSHQESRKDPYHDHFIELVSSMPKLQNIVKSYFLQHSIELFYKLRSRVGIILVPNP